MMRYPEIYYSDEVKRILNSKPPLPEKPKEPEYVADPRFPTSHDYSDIRVLFLILFVVSIVLFVVGFFINQEKNLISTCSFYSSILFYILVRIFNNKVEEYKCEQEQYKRNIELRKKYEIEYAEYKEEKKIYNETVNEIMTDGNIERFRNKQLNIYFAKRKFPKFSDCETERVKKGITELFFANLLAKEYTVYTNQKVRIVKGYYYPDIILVHNNIYIDIEIDEPYTNEDGKPIHYAVKNIDGHYYSIDEDRNDFFRYVGFEVIRFAEEQIVKNTIDCIKVIKKVIAKLTTKITKIKVPHDFIIQKWTQNEANKMAKTRYRDTYIDFFKTLNINEILKKLNNNSNQNNAKINQNNTHTIKLNSIIQVDVKNDISTEIIHNDKNIMYKEASDVEYSNDGAMLLKCNNKELQEYVIKEGTKVICKNAFCGCNLLQSIIIPNSVTKIEEFAFQYCGSLKSITIPSQVSFIGRGFICESGIQLITNQSPYFKIHNQTLYFGTVLHSYFGNAYSITPLDGTTKIGQNAFSHCKSLRNIFLPDTVRYIDEHAFEWCQNVINIKLPNEIGTIAMSAFEFCLALKNITLPNSLSSIGINAFTKCESLQSIIIPNSVREISISAFYGCKSLKRIIMQNGVKKIGISAFDDCSALRHITFPNSVTDIGGYALSHCKKLKSVNIPDGVESINDDTFWNCTNLKYIIIPKGTRSKYAKLLPKYKSKLIEKNCFLWLNKILLSLKSN